MQNSSCAETNDRAQMNGAVNSHPSKKPSATSPAAQQIQQVQQIPDNEPTENTAAEEKKPSSMPVEQQFGSFL